ncbi:hypothetical protein EJ04DRAFT_66082 [Polyplosphaeria fusca]|uniref:Uncharacterized protein n=1 Tax=Polyplosphaeria fusca TaxID=682080 RepID=A0A9P4UV35_9PLEO|nr:hypothetical protein EJ04DRAFT_66082 [Polyplosphaeria fusca]
MEHAPPYSPKASWDERQLPQDFDPVQIDEAELRRPRAGPSRHDARTDGSDVVEGQGEVAAPAPAASLSTRQPPDYAPLDTLARSFRLDPPFVYTTKTSNVPRYQMMQDFTRSGRPRKLHMRRLMATEARRCSLPSPRVRYDEDATMYATTAYEMPGLSATYEMRGHRSTTLNGVIRFEGGSGIFSGKWTKIWQLTKNSRRDSLLTENEGRLQKYGYRADDEWDRRLLFLVRKGRWEDGDGKHVAVEEKDGARAFEVLGHVDGPRKDLLVSCWVMRIWLQEGLRWEGDVRGW